MPILALVVVERRKGVLGLWSVPSLLRILGVREVRLKWVLLLPVASVVFLFLALFLAITFLPLTDGLLWASELKLFLSVSPPKLTSGPT